MKTKLLIGMVLLLFVLPLVISDESFIFRKDAIINLKIPVINDDNSQVTSTTDCTIIIKSPSEELLTNNQNMTFNDGGIFNLTFSNTSSLGEYPVSISCNDGIDYGFSSFSFLITPNGELPTTSKGLMYLGLLGVFFIFFGICLYGGKENEGVVGRSAFYLTAYLFLIGITFISWNLALDYLTSSPFIASFFRIIWLVLMYALFPVIFILTFYTMWMMKQIDVIQNMVNKGMPIDEAYERTVKSGMSRRKQW